MHFKIRVVRFKTGERMPLLFDLEPFCPVLLVLLYVAIKRRKRAVNTILTDVRVLGWLFTWCATEGIDLETLLMSGGTLSERQLTTFGRWLRSLRNEKIVGRIGKSDDAGRETYLLPETFNDYMAVVKAFLIWAARRYLPGVVDVDAIQTLFADVKLRIERTFDAIWLGGKGEARAKGLDPHEKQRLLEVARPGSRQNPFRPAIQHRNYLIVRVFLAGGTREGELAGIYVEDAPTQENSNWLRIVKRQDNPLETRARAPQAKTVSRNLKLTPALSDLCDEYVEKHRFAVIGDKRKYPNHPYLFISERGGPLSMSSIQHVFATLKAVCFPDGDVQLNPQILRNTFCNEFMEWAIEVKGWDMEKAKSELRELCGWSATSQMPDRYARKYLQAKANRANAERLAEQERALRELEQMK